MQKNIFVVILTFNILATAAAVASPITLFVQQCLQYEPALTTLDTSQPPAYQALQFDQLTLGFNNFNDRLNYYRDIVSPQQRESLLMCQLHLADELTKLLSQPKLVSFIDNLSNSKAPYSQLATQLEHIKVSQLDIETKSKLHNAQATIRRNLSNQNAELVFNDPNCRLATKTASQTPIFDISLAKYLLVQDSEQCRKSTWQAYQQRVMTKNSVPLETIKSIKHELRATRINSSSYNSNTLLSPQEKVMYLNSQTHNIDIAPWNIGKALAKQTSTAYSGPTSSLQLVKEVFSILETFNLNFELIPHGSNDLSSTVKPDKKQNESVYRVWHKERLIGEFFVSVNNKTTSNLIRQPVIGQQFSQVSLSMPETIKNRRQAIKLVKAIAENVTGMSRGSQFYIINKFGISTDNHLLGYYWLSDIIQQQLDYLALSNRELLAKAYKKQLRIFRSKIAIQYLFGDSQLSDLTSSNNTNDNSINQSFSDSFDQSWAQANTMIYSFNGIANEGVEYYHPLWQQTLASLINKEANASITNSQVFDTLVVNEENLTLIQQLAIILSTPNDPQSIIRRALNVGNSQI